MKMKMAEDKGTVRFTGTQSLGGKKFVFIES